MLSSTRVPKLRHEKENGTGKSLLEALILASTNPQYDKRLFIDLPVQYMKAQKLRTCCVHKFFWMSKQKQFMYTTCSELLIFMY